MYPDRKSPAVFLDRDGTINPDPGYIDSPDKFKLFPGVCEAVRALNEGGYRVFVVTNQSGIGRGLFSEEELREVHNKMVRLFEAGGAVIDRVYFSPYFSEAAVEKYRRNPRDRKPGTGMLRRAAKEFNLDLEQSWMVGDRPGDIVAGHRAGCRTILVLTGCGRSSLERLLETGNVPDFLAENLRSASSLILDRDRRLGG